MVTEPLWIAEADMAAAIDLVGAVQSVRDALVLEDAGTATTLLKTATEFAGSGTLHALGGTGIALDAGAVVGTKSWAHTPGGATPLVILWDADTGALRAVIEAFALGQLRTAAVSAIATDVLASPQAAVLAIVGTGKQAMPQVAAVASQRVLRQIRVYSPNFDHRAAFCARVRDRLPSTEVVDCPSLGAATVGADIITTATRSESAFLTPDHVGTDSHVNALGAITRDRRELDASLVAAAGIVVSDSPATAAALSDELESAERIVPLSKVVAEYETTTVASRGLSVFKAMGLGLADVAVGAAVLKATIAAGRGTSLPALVRVAPDLFGRHQEVVS